MSTGSATSAPPRWFGVERADVLWALGLFAFLLVAKWILVVLPYEGIAITDERLYYRLTQMLSQFQLPPTAQYPPLYPFLLAPAFWFAGGSLTAIAALSSFYSALSVVPFFVFARALMPRMYAGFATLATCLLPWHYILPRTMLSENVFIGLLVTAGLMAIWAPTRGRWWWDAGFGVLLGMLYLTRYISLVLIPALILVWWLREWGQQAGEGDVQSMKARFGRFGLVIAMVAASYGWWVVAQAALPETTASDALGFVITSRTNPAQHTLDRLWIYVRWYAAYFLLLAVPVMGLVMQSFRQAATEWITRRYPTLYARAVSLVVIVGGALFVAVSRHSWRAHYNYPDPVRIMGRYLIPMAPLFIILGFAALYRISDYPFRSRLRAVGWLLGVPALLAVVARQVVVGDWLLPFRIRQLTDRGSVDGFSVHLLGNAFWVLAAICLVTATVIAIWHPKWRWAPAALAAAVGLQLLWPMPGYVAHLQGYQDAASHGARIARTIADREPADKAVVIGVTTSVTDAVGLRQKLGLSPGISAFNSTLRINMEVRGQLARAVPEPPIWVESDSPPLDYVLMNATEAEPDAEILGSWVRGGETYVLIEAPDRVSGESVEY